MKTNKKKTKQLVFTLKSIIKAIKTEPLSSGSWVNTDSLQARVNRSGEIIGYRNEEKCLVCAVGAALRSAGVEKTKDIENFAHQLTVGGFIYAYHMDSYVFKKFLNRCIDEEKYFNALSCKFENLCYKQKRNGFKLTDAQMSKVIKKLIKWINGNFPNKIEVIVEK